MSGTQAQAGQRITAAWLNLNIPGAWLPITGQNGWTNHGGASVTFQARQYNSVTLEVIGIIGGTTAASGTTVGSLPAGLPLPVTSQPASGLILAGTGAGSAFTIVVQNNGTIQIEEAITGANELGFHFFVSLDA